jgi:hypothetical protein
MDPYGQVFDVQGVEREIAAAGVCIRTGCFCNPGAAEAAFRLTKPDVAKARNARTVAEARLAAGNRAAEPSALRSALPRTFKTCRCFSP